MGLFIFLGGKEQENQCLISVICEKRRCEPVFMKIKSDLCDYIVFPKKVFTNSHSLSLRLTFYFPFPSVQALRPSKERVRRVATF